MRIHLNIYIPLQKFSSELMNGLKGCDVKGKGKGTCLYGPLLLFSSSRQMPLRLGSMDGLTQCWLLQRPAAPAVRTAW